MFGRLFCVDIPTLWGEILHILSDFGTGQILALQRSHGKTMRDAHDHISPLADRLHVRAVLLAAAVGILHAHRPRRLVDRDDVMSRRRLDTNLQDVAALL